jgi:aryl-alcohol dehydrogenase-like predicted oxidoreductase
MNSLVLGTAQLGLHYGIANKTGQPDQATANAIVKKAWESGICEFDTAQGYGTSEEVLGKALHELGIASKAQVISKFHPDLNHLNADAMSNAFDESIKRLGVSCLSGMMLHREELLSLWDKGLAEILHGFVLSGRVKQIGVSVYSPKKALQALNTDGIDIIQIPTNILDRRFENAGVFKLADKKKKQVYIRSIFLQGLLLMNADDLPEKMAYAKPVLKKLGSISSEFGLTRRELALGYVKTEMPESKVIFGADIPEHVSENAASWKKAVPVSLCLKVKEVFDSVDEKILNPVLWP